MFQVTNRPLRDNEEWREDEEYGGVRVDGTNQFALWRDGKKTVNRAITFAKPTFHMDVVEAD